eukprot:52541-Amphidinium_carterae.2
MSCGVCYLLAPTTPSEASWVFMANLHAAMLVWLESRKKDLDGTRIELGLLVREGAQHQEYPTKVVDT